MNQQIILDTGVLVAYFRKSDRFHQWAVTQWRQVDLPVFTCDAVISEACFLFRDLPHIQQGIIELIEGNVITISFDLQGEASNIRHLMNRYESVPMSFADACLVRMSEQIPNSAIMTLDSDFNIYRKNRNEEIFVIQP
ncbi:MAG: PIN domain-containing protein [Aphanizomenon flos-aquae KM1D3_PB]|uniref:PIN domain-containing protein n=1 Tax=Dolichospermum heterosporum TAC447 TaxID=747523 RepID=A0ABY5LYT2_9CYAN|nr:MULTISPECIES: PIN domain-containing protein [Aphanizomenonaceae]KHG41036.1 pilus assembly protein [Aphanizomenon flos-aquae 2012/KM1/D3]QSV72053.1 MAG: PIN domain-containing protein [Aphanizomenon flos-aquae KM1D3_PB]UUO16159.1 PIN domain-containing protein [Dolichospermum heterosporum TAC447]